jgi:hypothetical protein
MDSAPERVWLCPPMSRFCSKTGYGGVFARCLLMPEFEASSSEKQSPIYIFDCALADLSKGLDGFQSLSRCVFISRSSRTSTLRVQSPQV